jgi:hypothetical protein
VVAYGFGAVGSDDPMGVPDLLRRPILNGSVRPA